MRPLAALAAIALAGCTDTLIGPFIEPTHDLASLTDLDTLGVSLAPGAANNPKAICARLYDREFAPWGEHYHLDDWLGPAMPITPRFRESGLNAEAIIDVDTGLYDYGQVALIWRSDGKRLKIYIHDQMDTASDLPKGCRLFGQP